ncbi:hypothetical protein NM688_g8866 [Phlebia brevispora]|uniref:Uncharacterized protein n=1 Tax=Phlebia brevispora TaxID=194682 RepID=A0ACC1RM20_9APHY|nr:hypothetical protein NM688_g8866 [Phlebia brevispora]
MTTSDEESFLSHFGALDELIQLIYQGPSKFVVLSSVNDAGWTVHLGLTGTSGRWWKGTWTEKDVNKFVGHVSGKLEDAFAENLAKAVLEGQLYVGDWSTEKGAKIDLTVGTAAKAPVHIPLTEMEPQDAAAYAASVFSEIASQAQDRQCKLHPPAFQSRSSRPVSPPPAKTAGVKRKAEEKEKRTAKEHEFHHSPSKAKGKAKSDVSHEEEDERAQAKIKELEAKLAKAEEQAKQKAPTSQSKAENKLASRAKTNGSGIRTAKGASLANPNKKARKIQAIEFEDD